MTDEKKQYVKKLIIKILIVVAIIAVLAVGMWYVMKALNVDSLEGLQNIVNKYGIWAYLIIGFIEIVQVIFVPISTSVVIGLAVACCGTWEAFFISWISISIGDIILHFIGRGAGGKFLDWLLSDKEMTEKIRKMLKERKLFFFVSLLNPIIPDEITMLVTGTCKMNIPYCCIIAILTRAVVIICQVFAFNLLFTTWWGILLVVLFFAFMIFASIITFKYGGKIESKIFRPVVDCEQCEYYRFARDGYDKINYCCKKGSCFNNTKRKCRKFTQLKD